MEDLGLLLGQWEALGDELGVVGEETRALALRRLLPPDLREDLPREQDKGGIKFDDFPGQLRYVKGRLQRRKNIKSVSRQTFGPDVAHSTVQAPKKTKDPNAMEVDMLLQALQTAASGQSVQQAAPAAPTR